MAEGERSESRYLSLRDFAKLVGVSHTAIAKAVDQGRLNTHPVPHRRYEMLLEEEALRDWEATRTAGHNNRFGELEGDSPPMGLGLFDGPAGDPQDTDLGSPESWAQEKVKQEALLAREKRLRAELERQELEGKLHLAEDVEAVWSDILVRCRQRLLGIPAKAATVLARLTEPGEIQRELQSHLNEALSELSEYSEYVPKIAEARKKHK